MKTTMILSRSILVTALGLTASFVACGGDDATNNGGGGDRSTGGATPELTFLAEFNEGQVELPEGLWVTADSKMAYVGHALTGQIIAVKLTDNTVADFAAVPAPPPNKGFVTGLTQSASGDLYVGAATLDSAAYKPGIYKVPATGGPVTTLFASDTTMNVPNGLVFDKDGNLFVTDSALGAIFKISPDGATVTNWITDPLLLGDIAPTNPCKTVLGVPFGANGLALSNNAFYVTNTDRATLVKIPIRADGTPDAAVELSKSDPTTCLPLKGADGIAADADGSILVAGNAGNALVRVGPEGDATVLVEEGLLDGPASVALATLHSKKYALVTNFGLITLLAMKTPRTGLLSYGPLQ
ncbi:SMP-30/gluconolactonase/LRE family protein [Sorangium sp. So ce321]|uniref:SMP-30/gluconolactonase/LRE family protein n=1 Tax=Sorangium sp. So ce321 TaxID=3133300 RepID=UPI003F5E743A